MNGYIVVRCKMTWPLVRTELSPSIVLCDVISCQITRKSSAGRTWYITRDGDHAECRASVQDYTAQRASKIRSRRRRSSRAGNEDGFLRAGAVHPGTGASEISPAERPSDELTDCLAALSPVAADRRPTGHAVDRRTSPGAADRNPSSEFHRGLPAGRQRKSPRV